MTRRLVGGGVVLARKLTLLENGVTGYGRNREPPLAASEISK